jgi:hypothetical protein
MWAVRSPIWVEGRLVGAVLWEGKENEGLDSFVNMGFTAGALSSKHQLGTCHIS